MRFTEEQYKALLEQRAKVGKIKGEVLEKVEKKQKYRARRTETEDGIFHSKAEAVRMGELRLMEKAGEITGLAKQVKFRLGVGGQVFETYVADFVYFDIRLKTWVVEDKKGYRTDEFKRKKRLMMELFGIEVLET